MYADIVSFLERWIGHHACRVQHNHDKKTHNDKVLGFLVLLFFLVFSRFFVFLKFLEFFVLRL